MEAALRGVHGPAYWTFLLSKQKGLKMNWNKANIRETMLSLETAAFNSARDNYLNYLSTARLDPTEPIENDEQAQA